MGLAPLEASLLGLQMPSSPYILMKSSVYAFVFSSLPTEEVTMAAEPGVAERIGSSVLQDAEPETRVWVLHVIY